ncbi:MAG: alpha/beta fold hydrolase [Pseudomonadota bacterium]
MNMTLRNASPETSATEVAIQSGEYRLKGTLFQPPLAPKAIVVLNGATGVPARYYAAFGRWLAEEQGYACLTYDYRDFGASAGPSMRASKATMTDWGVYDQQAARDFAKRQFPTTPVWVVGHSLGGLCFPFQERLDDIERVITVGAGMVNVRDHPWRYQPIARMFWYGPMPLVTLLAGYMPGKTLRIGQDIPSGVYWQWRAWCTRTDFFARDFGTKLPFPDWQGLKANIKYVAMSDDDLVPPAAVWRLMQCNAAAPTRQLTLRPGDYGLTELGHITVFAERNKAAWAAIIA